MSFPPLFLKSQHDRRIRKGHLWVYSNEVDSKKSPLNNFAVGEQVVLTGASGQALGLAVVNPNNLICARLVSRSLNVRLGESLFKKRIQEALSLRQAIFDAPYYRLLFGDADFLPGVVADRFGDYVVLQIASAAMEQHKQSLLQALQAVLGCRGVLLRNDHAARQLENLPLYSEVVGDLPEQLELIENGVQFRVPSRDGQKTGWFYDHRCNRAMLAQWVSGKRVLDVFSYVGGWGVQLAKAGAKRVTCVDSSATALSYVEQNAELNACDDRMEAIEGSALEVLKFLIEEQEKFDVVVLDPPAFIKRKKDQKSGEAAYRHINELAIRLLQPGGLLLSASCSMQLPAASLQDIVRGAAMHLDRKCQLVYCGGQGPDHPVHPAIPETNYLKAQLFRILSRQ
ncbi:MAG: class I SAM-dependent rRNA methyltransferase [Cellvibrionaceae bacterium]|nr:class I SAM-dependent rRNA methyltransferase [Cellvibrionaceae bacterium]